MSARTLAAAILALAAAAMAAGCSRADADYPAGWPPLVSGRHGCPDLAGAWRIQADSPETGLAVLQGSAVVNPDHRRVHWEAVSIAPSGAGNGIALTFAQQSDPRVHDAQVRMTDARIDVARCANGLATIEGQEGSGSWTLYRLGKDKQGRLVGQRVEHRSGEALIQWGDRSALHVLSSTQSHWSHWEPISTAEFARIAEAAQQDADTPSQRRARTPDPAPPLPAEPPARIGGLSVGEAQAEVLAVLPDSILFKSVTASPRGYRLQAHADNPGAVVQLMDRLARSGHLVPFPAVADQVKLEADGSFEIELTPRK